MSNGNGNGKSVSAPPLVGNYYRANYSADTQPQTFTFAVDFRYATYYYADGTDFPAATPAAANLLVIAQAISGALSALNPSWGAITVTSIESVPISNTTLYTPPTGT